LSTALSGVIFDRTDEFQHHGVDHLLPTASGDS